MSVQENLDALRRNAFFQNVSEEHLESLADIARVVDFPARKTLFNEFDKTDDVFVLLSGEVSLVVCEPKVGCRQLTTVRGGELLGWSPVLERDRMTATAVTLSPVTALAFGGEELLALFKKDPVIGYEFMAHTAKVLAERLFATRVQLLRTCGVHLPEVALESD